MNGALSSILQCLWKRVHLQRRLGDYLRVRARIDLEPAELPGVVPRAHRPAGIFPPAAAFHTIGLGPAAGQGASARISDALFALQLWVPSASNASKHLCCFGPWLTRLLSSL